MLTLLFEFYSRQILGFQSSPDFRTLLYCVQEVASLRSRPKREL